MDERTRNAQRIDRRSFLARSLGAALATAGFFVIACASDDGGAGPGNGGGDDCTNAHSGVVGGDHSHNLADVCQEDAGGSLNLTLSGGGHSHTLSLSSSQVDQILAGNTVTVNSSGGDHVHPVTFN